MPKRSYTGGSYSASKRYKGYSSGYSRPTYKYSRRRYYRRGGYVKPEKKFFDVNLTTTTIANTGTVLIPSINLVPQGNTESTMVGRKINITRISAKGYIVKPAATNATLANTVSSDQARVYLILDKQCNGAAPTIAQIFEDTDINTLMELENSKRFQIIKEWNKDVDAEVNYDGSTNYFSGLKTDIFKWSKKCNYRIDFAPEATPGTRAITEVKTNNIALVGFSLRGGMQLAVRFRIRYEDY